MADAPAGHPEDFVIATGRQESVRRFIDLSAQALGWASSNGGLGPERPPQRQRSRRRIDPRYFRPAEVETPLDPTNAREKLGWTPTTTLEELVNEMIPVDKEEACKEAYLQANGFQVVGARE